MFFRNLLEDWRHCHVSVSETLTEFDCWYYYFQHSHGKSHPQGHTAHHHGSGPHGYGPAPGPGRHPHGHPPDYYSRCVIKICFLGNSKAEAFYYYLSFIQNNDFS